VHSRTEKYLVVTETLNIVCIDNMGYFAGSVPSGLLLPAENEKIFQALQ
jgi:hypothetical protein